VIATATNRRRNAVSDRIGNSQNATVQIPCCVPPEGWFKGWFWGVFAMRRVGMASGTRPEPRAPHEPDGVGPHDPARLLIEAHRREKLIRGTAS
jgi:hypothetical protein